MILLQIFYLVQEYDHVPSQLNFNLFFTLFHNQFTNNEVYHTFNMICQLINQHFKIYFELNYMVIMINPMVKLPKLFLTAPRQNLTRGDRSSPALA